MGSGRVYSEVQVFEESLEELSERLHSANASAEQFALSRKDIEDHFEQSKLLPLKS